MLTLVDYVAVASARLQSAGLPHDEATQSAIVLARFVLGWTAADWISRSRDAIPPDFASRFLPLIDRRARHEPVAYITGEREFYGRPFKVTRDVLIPRPETEIVVEAAISVIGRLSPSSFLGVSGAPPPLARAPAFEDSLSSRSSTSSGRGEPVEPRGPRALARTLTILDFGTGSGCLAVTLALECPSAKIIATDVSPAALEVAQENAQRLRVADRIEFRHVDDTGAWFLRDGGQVSFDLVVANAPYVPEVDRASLPPEVVDFEPATALFGGVDGLQIIRTLLPMAAKALAPGGWLVMEIGHGQLSELQDLIQGTAGLTFDHFRPDLQGIPRVVVAALRDRRSEF